MTEVLRTDKKEIDFIYYVYAVTPEDNNVLYPEKGIDGVNLLESITCGNLQALVSRVPYGLYNRDSLKQKMADPTWLENAVRRHTAIVNSIRSDLGIIPMRFLTLCKSSEDVESFLSQYAGDIEAVLDSVRGSSEWGVKVFCDSQKLQRLILEEDEHVRMLEKQIAELRAGTSFLMEKKKMRLAQETLARICNQCKEECHSRLVSLASSVEEVALQKEGISERTDSMIFNSAYLVNKNRSDDFEKMVAYLNQQFGDQGFELSLSGPWPPYHFVNRVF